LDSNSQYKGQLTGVFRNLNLRATKAWLEAASVSLGPQPSYGKYYCGGRPTELDFNLQFKISLSGNSTEREPVAVLILVDAGVQGWTLTLKSNAQAHEAGVLQHLNLLAILKLEQIRYIRFDSNCRF